MRRKRFAYAMGSIVLLAGLGVARATPAVTLAGTNVITGSEPGAIAVHVPTAVTVDPLFSTDVTIAGGGRFAGIALAGIGLMHDTSMAGINMNRCWAPGCSSSSFDYMGYLTRGESFQFETVLPAGDYMLYLVADGAPVTVTLVLHGLSGTAAIAPPPAPTSVIKVLAPRLAAGPSPTQFLYSAADTGTIGPLGGVLASHLVFGGSTHLVSHFGVCEYFDYEPIAYLPECPEANTSGHFLDLMQHDDYQTGLYGIGPVEPSEITVQAYYEAAAMVEDVHASALWLSF